METHQTDVCIVGGGPAGMLLALLLAHRGVNVLVLEQHKDFAREYRGEVLMPRFTESLRQLRLDDWLLTLPHLKLKYGEIFFGGKTVGRLAFSNASKEVPYALWMPQPILLQGLHDKAKGFPSFDMWFGASVKHLVQNGTVEGVVVQRDGKQIEVRSRVVVGCDGRYSTVLKDGKFQMEYEDHKFDVLWFTIAKPADYDNTFRVLLSPKRSYLFLPKHPDSIQVGILTGVGGMAELKQVGIEALKKEISEAHPLLKGFAASLKDFSAFHPLQAHLHLVKEWARDGVLLIGDSAHCFSPAGAIGVSMAAGSAIIAADVILRGLKSGSGPLPVSVLSEVQKVYEPEVRVVHSIQRRLTGGGLGNLLPVRWLLPVLVTMLANTPFFKKTQKRLMALPKPLPVSRELGF